MAIFADCINAEIAGGWSEKAQKYDDVIHKGG